MEKNKFDSKTYQIPLTGGNPQEIHDYESLVSNKSVSSDEKMILTDKPVKINKILGKDLYPSMQKSDVFVYDELDYRHWDTWNDGTHNHVFYAPKKQC
jgi:hypothetical protein